MTRGCNLAVNEPSAGRAERASARSERVSANRAAASPAGCRDCAVNRGHISDRARPARAQRTACAFTTMELMVSIALLVMTAVAVGEAFNISSETTSRTVAHADSLQASATLQRRLANQLAKIRPGLLIIESPPATDARAETPGGPPVFRIRQDRLVFIVSGEPGEFQSFTDPTQGSPLVPTREPASSPEALVYFGPGIPLAKDYPLVERPFDDASVQLTASEWVFAHRAILLLTDDPSHLGWTPPRMSDVFTGGANMINGGSLYAGYRDASMDAVVSANATLRATADSLVNLIQGRSTALVFSEPSLLAPLWEPNVTPTAASLVPRPPTERPDYYTRTGFTFQPRLADFRIEWTDGRRIDPYGPDGDENTGDENFGTRWFGLLPDPANLPDPNNPGAVTYAPIMRQHVFQYGTGQHVNEYADSTVEEVEAFDPLDLANGDVTQIEWGYPSTGLAHVNARYRAIWRADTWQYRPKALRFTYRIYDEGDRLRHATWIDLDEDGVRDPEDAAPAMVTRFGTEFSIVVPLP